MGSLGRLLRQGGIVEEASCHRVQREVELVVPAPTPPKLSELRNIAADVRAALHKLAQGVPLELWDGLTHHLNSKRAVERALSHSWAKGWPCSNEKSTVTT